MKYLDKDLCLCRSFIRVIREIRGSFFNHKGHEGHELFEGNVDTEERIIRGVLLLVGNDAMSDTDVRTFKAASMQQALEIVRKELGPDAVILHTRELPQPKFRLWGTNNEKVEITAGLGINVPTPKALQQSAMQQSAASRAYAAAATVSARPAEPSLSVQRRPVEPALPVVPPRRFNAPPPPAAAACPIPVAHPGAAQSEDISRQLESIQRMVEKLSHNSVAGGDEMQSDLFQLYTGLIESEVDEDLARELICQIKAERSPGAAFNADASRARLGALVETRIRCAAPIRATRGQQKVVALVGPTGVGKTTTIAKLAANFRLRDGIRLGLVTVDTYRIAAVEQLRTYAEIIDLPMKVVTSPDEMGRALDELSGLDLILIDTAGRSPRDEPKIQELKLLLAEARADEVHLVLSMASSPRSLEATAEKFAAAGTTSLILTKLDEAASMGPLLTIANRLPLPISYLTTGQDVPDDIEAAVSRRMSRLVMGEESLSRR